MQLNPVPTELTTAASDVALGFLAIFCAAYLWRIAEYDSWKVGLWCWVFGVLAASALLGAVAHGFTWSTRVWNLLWIPLFLLLGFAVALFVVGATYDWLGQSAARKALPVMVVLALVFFVATRMVSGTFAVFVIYEAAAMLCALAVYGYLAATSDANGMGLMVAGVALSIVAAAVQASQAVSITVIWQFDHNGVFHMIQMIALVVLTAGLRSSLISAAAAS